MLNFTEPLKIYLFKNRNIVNLNIRVSDNVVNAYNFDTEIFEKLLDKWQDPDGVDLKVGKHHWYIQHKTSGPRPQRKPADYVRISISVGNGQYFHYRVGWDDMHKMEHEYFYQKRHEMYWD